MSLEAKKTSRLSAAARSGPRMRAWVVIAVVVAVAAAGLLLGCGGAIPESAGSTATPVSDLILASTTSTQDSGLFDELIPAFQSAYPQYTVKIIAAGSGEAIKLGERKDADVLLVHSPAAEEEFVQGGYGLWRRDVMYNDFIIIGPEDDPAEVKGLTSAAEAMAGIASRHALFFSRNDQSGTHKKELQLWAAAGVVPEGDWYRTTGQGMGETMRIAAEKGGCTLADRGTYLSAKDRLALTVLVEGDPVLFNQYGVLPVAGARNQQGAVDFANWITSAEGQELIRNFGVSTYGRSLFIPNAS